MHQSLSAFHMHAVIPVIQCTVNTVGQPQLCHSTLCILREVSLHVMPRVYVYVTTLMEFEMAVIWLAS